MNKFATLAALSFNYDAASTAQIAAFYNEVVADFGGEFAVKFKPVTRFADRKTAVARTERMLTDARFEVSMAPFAANPRKPSAVNYVRGHCPACGSSSDITCGQAKDRKTGQVLVNEHQALCHSCGHEFDYDSGKALRRASAPKDAAARAQAIAASWADPEVFAARATRNAVTFTDASGTRNFRSVRHAFEQLGLPMGVHIRFRGQLKAAGKLEGFGGTWVVVAAE